MTKNEQILAKIHEAQAAVSAAESDLQRLVGEIGSSPRAEKTTVTEVVGDAFSRLRAAKANLHELQTLVAGSRS